MLLQVMKVIALFFYWTWFIWPFVFIYSFAYGIASIVKNENSSKGYLFIATISLIIILSGILAPIFHV